MRITSLIAFFAIILGSLDLLTCGLLKFLPSSLLFGEGSLVQRLYFCLVGASAIFFAVFVKIFKPFKSLLR